MVYHGAKAKNIKPHEFEESWIVITTYGMIAVRNESKKYKCPLWDIDWDRVIFDESHHVRNINTSVFKGAKKLKSPIKWMVTEHP